MTDDMKSMMDDAFGPDAEETGKLGVLANELVEVSKTASQAEARKKEIKAEIISILDARGDDGAIAGGRRLGFTTRKYYGVAQGESPEVHAQNLKSMKDWLEMVAPEVNIPASANIGKALTAFIDSNPDAEIPDFVAVTEKRSLTNRQA